MRINFYFLEQYYNIFFILFCDSMYVVCIYCVSSILLLYILDLGSVNEEIL